MGSSAVSKDVMKEAKTKRAHKVYMLRDDPRCLRRNMILSIFFTTKEGWREVALQCLAPCVEEGSKAWLRMLLPCLDSALDAAYLL